MNQGCHKWLPLLVALAAMTAWELCVRSLGFVPEPRDNLDHWSLLRHRATETERPVILVGSSRTQWGIHRETLELELGRPVIQLGLFQASPAPVFRHLAADSSLKGATLVVEQNATLLACGSRYGHFDARARAAIADYESSTRVTRMETDVNHLLQRKLVFLSGRTGVLRALPGLLLRGELPRPSPTTRGFDRQLFHRFRRGDPRPGVSDRAIADVLRDRCPVRSLDAARAFFDDVGRATAREHRVILTRLPVTGEYGQLERWLLSEQDRELGAPSRTTVFDRASAHDRFQLFEDTHLTGSASIALTRELAE